MSKKPLYGNWEFRAPDNEVIFYDSIKRANWYLDRELATIVAPNTIKLKFEPAGRRDPNDLYSLSKKSNNCVVCNTSTLDVLTKHHIVPSEYRKFFPVEIKSRSSHDIVPICREHHNEYETQADKLKQKLADKYGFALNRHEIKDEIHTAIKLSKVLLNVPVNIPADRLEQIREAFIKSSGIIHVTEQSILDFCLKHKEHKARTHGDMIIEQVKKEGKLFEFVQMWRQHFLDTTNPQFMPQHWSVNRPLIIE